MCSSGVCKSDQAGPLWPGWGEREKAFGPADAFTGQEKWQLVQKNIPRREVATLTDR